MASSSLSHSWDGLLHGFSFGFPSLGKSLLLLVFLFLLLLFCHFRELDDGFHGLFRQRLLIDIKVILQGHVIKLLPFFQNSTFLATNSWAIFKTNLLLEVFPFSFTLGLLLCSITFPEDSRDEGFSALLVLCFGVCRIKRDRGSVLTILNICSISWSSLPCSLMI
jgi:hypothetical protein